MGNELSSKRSSSSRATSKSKGSGSLNPVEAISSTLCNLCAPGIDDSQQHASVDPAPVTPPGKQKTGRSSYQPTAPRTRNNRTTATAADKSDRSIKTSIKNVQKDVSMKSAEVRKKVVPTDDSCHTFAASAAQSGHYRKGNDYVMITDALSDVRVK